MRVVYGAGDTGFTVHWPSEVSGVAEVYAEAVPDKKNSSWT